MTNTFAEFYIVITAYHQPGTSLVSYEIAPLNPERASCRRNIVEDIACGQICDVHEIWHGSTEQPLQNVTKDIAEEVLLLMRGEFADAPKGSLNDFLEEHLGCFAWQRRYA